ncbi:hypothetical protein AU193_11640 [Mycobacterium sp. GA-1285]|nr:hypothetical protein AU193_11640 [Mycobacterium sp. GA-1285]
MSASERLGSPMTRVLERSQRRELGLPKNVAPWPRRNADGGWLELQAYDKACFPGLVDEWAEWKDQRPLVGSLTLELPTAVDDEVSSWISAGTAPTFFGFGGTRVQSPAETIEMIGAPAQSWASAR